MPESTRRRSRSASTARGAPVAACSSSKRRRPSDTSRTISSAQRSPTTLSVAPTSDCTVLSLDHELSWFMVTRAPRGPPRRGAAGSLQGMQPAVPDRPHEDDPLVSADDVGAFEPGTPFSRWALARYIVGRVILERVSWSLLVVAGVLIVLAVLAGWRLDSVFLAVVLGIIALFVLLLRTVLRAVLKRLMAAKTYGPLEARLSQIIDGARKGVLAELRRVGLPSRVFTLPL